MDRFDSLVRLLPNGPDGSPSSPLDKITVLVALLIVWRLLGGC
jgi:hypothetical protein